MTLVRNDSSFTSWTSAGGAQELSGPTANSLPERGTSHVATCSFGDTPLSSPLALKRATWLGKAALVDAIADG